MTLRRLIPGLTLALLLALASPASSQVDARMFRYPDVSATRIAFVYAGDIWVVEKEGGIAHRLSSPPGEETFPRFSPDGSRIAFSGNYDGNEDVYVMPALGGIPERVTHHPMGDRLLDWTPDGRELLFASGRAAGRQRFNQIFRVGTGGGLPEKLPVPYGEFGSLSPDGTTLAYMPIARDFRTWKRYRGGMAPEIWLFDLESYEARNISGSDANDGHPMWHQGTLYFLSDRGPERRYNIWAYDLETGSARQVTRFEDYDVTFPAIGPEEIVFQAGGRLYLLDLADETPREVTVDVVTDRTTLKPRRESVGDLIRWASISPTGKRAVFQARGDVFTVPAEHGPVRNLTRSSGVAERYPSWSPDGAHVAVWSDASGEYELTLLAADGREEPRKLTSMGAGYRYQPFWTPGSDAVAYVDEVMRLWIHDLEEGETVQVERFPEFLSHGGLRSFVADWSPDGRWLVYARPLTDGLSAIHAYDRQEERLHQLTSGYYADARPAFGPDGDYLFFLSNRNMSPVYSDMDNSWAYPNSTHLVAVSLRDDVPSPLAPRNDEEPADGKSDEGGEDRESGEEEGADEGAEAVEIQVDDFERRLVVLPPDPGNYTNLRAVSGKVLYRRLPRSGSGDDESPIGYWDLEEREEKTVLDDAGPFDVSADGKKLLVTNEGRWAIVEVAPGQKMEAPLRTGEMQTVVDPRAEWSQIFTDAWRFQRDFFYDPDMHGLDWPAVGDHYRALLDDAVTRSDVNWVIGELIAELNASHTYRGGGDVEGEPRTSVGLLGVDWALEDGAYRIADVVRGAPWDAEARGPLDQPGVDVGGGDWVLAVNGIPLDPAQDPYAAFQGLGGETVTLTVNDEPTTEGAREVVVETLSSETRLRHLEWIEANRRRVEEATDGRVGYIYVRSTGVDAQNELVRQFTAQYEKEGLIVDERFNSGGQIPDRFVELLNRPPLAWWAVRAGEDWQWPPVANFGPKAMLINGWSGSGGDAFPDYFRKRGLGPLIGMRTWGGLIGISGAPGLVDGGRVTVPTFRMYDPDGTWFAEGHGVEPDIRVVDDPGRMARGEDPQLERAIREVMRQLRENPFVAPDRPEYEDRSGGWGDGSGGGGR